MKNNIFLVLISIWILFAFTAISYNAIKVVFEVREWAFLSDIQKREKIFGDLYGFYNLLNTNTDKDAELFLYSPNVMPFYVQRYYLYPKKVFFTTDKSAFLHTVSTKKYTYIALYDFDTAVHGYVKIGELKNAQKKGSLYKLP